MLQQLAIKQAEAGEFEAALRNARAIEIPKTDHMWTSAAWAKAVALRLIGVAQIKTGQAPGAIKSFAEAADVAQAMNNPNKQSLLVEIAVERAQAGDAIGAIATAKNLQGMFGDMALARVAATLAQNNQLDAAFKTTAELKNVAQANPAWIEIALAQATHGDPTAALQTLGKIKNAEAKAEGLRRITAAANQRGQTVVLPQDETDPLIQAALLTGAAEGLLQKQ